MMFTNSEVLLPLASLNNSLAPDAMRDDYRYQAVDMLRHQAWKNAEVRLTESVDKELKCLRIRGSMPDWRLILEDLVRVMAQARETGETWRVYERTERIRDLLAEYTRGDDE